MQPNSVIRLHSSVIRLHSSVIRLHSSELNESVEREVSTSRVACSVPVSASQIRTVLSCEPDASRRPSGEKATDETDDVWPCSVACSVPVSASQIRTVLSYEPDASRRPSGEKATDQTDDVWPCSVCKHWLQFSSTSGLVLIHGDLS